MYQYIFARRNHNKLLKIIQQTLVEEIVQCSFLSLKFVGHDHKTLTYYRYHKLNKGHTQGNIQSHFTNNRLIHQILSLFDW